MSDQTGPLPDAWVAMPSDAQVQTYLGEGHPYNFGFVVAMGRLVMSHEGIAPYFGMLFRRIMFEEGALSRREREMVAAVAAAAQDCHY